ncbi:hypothetical protein AAF712_016204 [Marasmius tenuissimus]|uniref:C2H2-type domain-containing protein n=1 Tax=Marasmius tenuissimus TaxID=585030 RepID=A0ABR2Z9M9_9AGAR
MPASPYRKTHTPRTIPCPRCGCDKLCKNITGLKNHLNSHADRDTTSSISSDDDLDIIHSNSDSNHGINGFHFDVFEDDDPPEHPPENLLEPDPRPGDPKKKINYVFHDKLNGHRCDGDGNFLPAGAPPPPPINSPAGNDWRPWRDGLEFWTANLLYRRMQTSAGNIDDLMDIITARHPDQEPLFADHDDLYGTIDACSDGAVPWEAFSVQYDGPRDPEKQAPWMDKEYMVYYRDPRKVLHRQLGDPDFVGEIETTPYEATSLDGKRQYQNFMSGNWAMREANKVIDDHPHTEGAMLCATIMGSDKTTVSVATGQNDYYPAYLSNGCLTNNAWKSHRGGVSLFMFLAIPKTLCPYMTTPDLVRFGDGYYRRVVHNLGPYIGDYPEQVLLACIVQGWCPKCTSPHDDLDGPDAGPRSHEHTQLVTEAIPNAMRQWDDYGIISGIMPFTYYFP